MKNPVGACIWSLPGDSFGEKMQLAKNCGLDGVQLELGTPESIDFLARPTNLNEALFWREKTGLSYASLGMLVFCEVAATDTNQHPILEALFLDAIRVASELEIPYLQIPNFFASELNSEEAIRNTAKLFRYACQKAESVGIDICTENVLTPPRLNELLALVDCPNFKVYFDTANPYAMAGLEAIELLEVSLPCLAQVHLKDHRDDKVPSFVGQGDVGFDKVYQTLRQSDYDGWYVFESPYVKLMQIHGMTAQEVLYADLRTTGYLQ